MIARRRYGTILMAASLLVAPVFAQSQTLKEYMALRKKHGISQAVGIEAIESFIGAKIMEVQGSVKGSFSMNGRTTYMVERADGGTIDVVSAGPVEWLGSGDIPARLIVRGTRETETSSLRAELLGAAPEAEIARIELASRPKTVPTKIIAPPKVGMKSPLFGPIGKGGGTASAPPKNWNVPTDQAISLYAGFIKKYNKRISDGQALEIARGIIDFSIRFGHDARLIMAMVLVESSFNPNTKSYAGAMGLGQLMPGTAASLGITNAYDTTQNLYGTARVLRGHIERYSKRTNDSFEALILSLAAYNAGSGAVRRHNYTVPPYRQTQNYVQKVIAWYRAFRGY